MLDFRKNFRPRNYRAPREQMRLLALVAAMVGILWMAVEARNPDHFRWIWTLGRTRTAVDAEVDTRFAPLGSAEADTFVVRGAGETADAARLPVAGSLTEADLETVRDDEPFRAAEQGAWFKLFDRLRTTDPTTLSRQSIGPISFIELYRQPREHRGELVTLVGTLRRSERVDAPQNDFGIEAYYRTWLFPRDNPTNPIVVYTLEVPRGFPQGMILQEQVELDGFFFKRWPYAAQDTVRSAPVVLARSLRWTAARPKESAAPVSPLKIVAVAAAGALVFVAFALRQTARPRPGKPVAGLFDGQAPAGPIWSGDEGKPGATNEANEGGHT
ncbi:MAG: hypothetical protein ACYC6Y_26575 [Thermoguttaceae bacterium]